MDFALSFPWIYLLDFHCLFHPSVTESGCASASPISILDSSIRNSLLRTVVHEIARHDGILNDSLISCLDFIRALRSMNAFDRRTAHPPLECSSVVDPVQFSKRGDLIEYR